MCGEMEKKLFENIHFSLLQEFINVAHAATYGFHKVQYLVGPPSSVG
jgi:hypothetical protein